MKRYEKYMDGIKAPDTLHQRLAGLEEPSKRPVPWKRYGAAAAALVLVFGLGAWGLGRGGWDALTANFRPCAVVRETASFQPDIAYVAPGEADLPGEKNLGGYEVRGEENGPETMVSYYVLPYIEYGVPGTEGANQRISLDLTLGEGYTESPVSREEIAAMLGGEDVLSMHLDWDAYELSGQALYRADGSLGLLMVYGYAGPLDHFEFSVMEGQLPPTCIAYAESVTQEIRGLTVTADKYDGEHGCDRRVSFMKDGCGFRFDLTSTDAAQAELLVSRLVCRIAAEGFDLPRVSTHVPISVEPSDPDGGNPSYGPDEAEDPAYSVPATYVCEVCGQSLPVGVEHSHALEGYYTCPVCGQTIPVGTEHYEAQVSSADGPSGVVPYDPDSGYICSGYPTPEPVESGELCGYPLAPEGWNAPPEASAEAIHN